MTYRKYFLCVAFLLSSTDYSQAQNRDSLDAKAVQYLQNQDFGHAVPILKEAAAAGSPKSQYNYAVCLLQGAGVAQNDSLANIFLERSANQNYVDAEFKLASSYRMGRGVQANSQKAVYWYSRAAELGDVESELDLAIYYRGDNGIPRDTVKMLYWLTRAATQRNPKDDTVATSSSGPVTVSTTVGYQTSAEISQIRYSLASMYLAGELVPKDSLQAYMWLLITNENKKDFPASKIMDGPCQQELIDQITVLESHLSSDQQHEAEQEAVKLLGRPLQNLARKAKLDLD